MTDTPHSRMVARPVTVTLAGEHYEMAHPTLRHARLIQADLASFYHRYEHLQQNGRTRVDADPGDMLRADAALRDIVAMALDIDPEIVYVDVDSEELAAAIQVIADACQIKAQHPDAQNQRRKKKRGGRNRRRGMKPQ